MERGNKEYKIEKSYKVRTSEGNHKTIEAISALHAVRIYIESTGVLDNVYMGESDVIEVEGYGTYHAIYDPLNDAFEVIEN